MSEINIQQIKDNVRLTSFTDPHFKTMRISVDMLIPLSELTAAKYGILPSLVSRSSRSFPNYTALSRKLAELYGASLDSNVRKMGAYQVLTVSANGIASRYALNSEDMFYELSQLLFSVLLDPLTDEDGNFPEDGFEQEKRQLLELKKAEYNDKILYAHQRCEELLFSGESLGVNRHGSAQEIESLSRNELMPAWNELLQKARFEIFTLGDCQPNSQLFIENFFNVGNEFTVPEKALSISSEVRRLTEEQPVAQSKLAMAFSVPIPKGERLLYQLMCMVFGGSPRSKLFLNVREKQGLCYYCSSSLDFHTSTIYVNSGVETENLEKAESAILEQLEKLQQGEVTEEELQSAKLAFRNSIRSVTDSLGAVEYWCLSRVFDQEPDTPEQAGEKLMAYTLEDVIRASKEVRLSAIFCLKGSELA